MAYQDSVQSFVRALRAPTDPPRPGDPQKIDIASEAWYTTSFYVPRKAEIILEWCMTRLLKDGTRYPASNPASDVRYWKLLQDILLPVRSKGSKTSSGSNTWLLPLLNRVPLLPIALSVLSNSLNLPVQKRDELYLYSSKFLALVWSLAAPKFSPDNLLECFGAMLRVLNEETVGSDESTGLIEICALVTSSLHTTLSNSSNKKKLSQAFMTSHIGVWLSFTSKEGATYSAIRTEICDLGVEFLFNVDSLKQIAENTGAKPLFEALRTHISSSSPHSLSNLPFLMTAFTSAIKKRRSLFSSGDSSIAETHSSAMLFFSSCEEILRGVGALHGTQAWQSRLDLLKVVEDESLFSPRSEDTAVLLKEEVESCVECLTSVDDEIVQIAVQCLCILSRIDHDLVEAVTSRILSRFLTVPRSPREEEYPATPAHEFLFLALSYHTKTRTLPVHISRLVDSCSLPSPYLSSLSIRMSYDGLVASPALTTNHLDRLSKAVRTFITPGQTLDTARRVIGMLRDIWERFHDVEKASAADYERGARKKRRTSTSESTRKAREEDADAAAVTFALATRIVAIVLVSLPLHTATEAEQAKVQAIITESFDTFVREAIIASRDAAISGSSDRRRDVWAAQVVGAAALRFLYTLHMSAPALHSGDKNGLGDLAAAVLKVDNSLPEYGVEIFRYLLRHESHPPNVQRQQVLFDAVLTFLEVHLPAHRSAPQAWLGRSSQLSYDETGFAFAAVALLRLLLDRNLQVVNAYASSEQQGRLVNLLHLADVELGYEDAQRGLSLVATVHECLHSANFWEQENIRSSFFVVQHARTSFLDTADVAKPKKRASGSHAESQMCDAVKAYTFLLYAPTECFPKTSRNDFLRRAMVLDFLLGSMPFVSTHRALQVVRTFLAKIISFLGSWEHEASGRYLHYLMTSPLPVSAEQVTRELVHGHLVAAFRAAVQGSTDVLLDAIQICREQPLGNWLLSKDPDVPLRSSTQQLMEIAMADSSASSFPPDLAGQLSTLFEHVVNQLHPLLRSLASHNVTERDEIMSYSDILLLWSRVISFGKYLGHPKNPSPGLGTQIAQAVCPSLPPCNCEDSSTLKFGSAIHTVLVSELQLFSREEDRVSHLQHIVTTCMIFMHPSISYQHRGLNENMANLLRTLSSSEFSSYLQFVCEALSSNGLALDKTACLIRLISLALHNAPENTLKIVQAYVKECLDVFVNSTKLSDAHVLRLPMLSFIKDLCSKKPASIRPQNVISIWTFLSRILAGSKAHDPETNVAIFHEIVSILGALVRLRRDLVVTTLPHLCNIIRQLILALRRPRPLLGAKQYSIVADTLPVWINPSHPLGVDESRDLTRLLTSLSTKTLVRVHSPSAELRKPESLTRPLSKHVTSVLQAYLDALNDPLCVLAADIRRELQPGLFVLCDMLNEHTRDSLMVSALDAGGKAAMKGLWREYEKQRYTGKG